MEAVRCTFVPIPTSCSTPGMLCGVSDQKSILSTPSNCATACCSARGHFCSLLDATRYSPPFQSSSKLHAFSIASSHGPYLARYYATVASSLEAAPESNAKRNRHSPRLPLKISRKSDIVTASWGWLGRGRRRIRTQATKPDGPADEERTLSEELDAFYESLDLEYESVWDTKPAWCQPWTILLTGTVGITGSWQLLHVPVLTGVVTGLVGLWWFVFLLAYPQSYKDMIAQRREYQERLAAENGRPLGRDQT
ncbi:hypothetical protein KFL_005650060 [Klebsormidium nitens]|uniref:DUF6737 domain-containing protein n=1 Tax=Klebsormidium nitens TaxID=105231 RepID=A0A1Y1IG47_KLENI|nr:hypothetical protein KFL_005650060 [Klebsormidium nitens]|eukprot:GAQ89814.1 hypothetical protein KFL_005650060 [Klebsormidium nitens]